MAAVGIDMGAQTVKVVVLNDAGQVVGRAIRLAGWDGRQAAQQALAEALAQAGLEAEAIDHQVATGAGRADAPAGKRVTEVAACSRGATRLFPAARTVIDVGAEEGRVVRTDGERVTDFAINERCAAGAGAFTEAMARALEVPLEEMGPLSLRSSRAVPLNAQCAVFAESEVVSLVHSNVAKEDLARAIHDAIAWRVVSLAAKVGCPSEVVLVGGLAKNVGFVESLTRGLEIDRLVVPEQPEYTGALGAAWIAAAGSRRRGGHR